MPVYIQILYTISLLISYMILCGYLPGQNKDDSCAFTRSEQFLSDRQSLKRLNARDLKDLIQHVLHHPEFDAAGVDHNMHERLMRAVEDGQMDIHDMWLDGDGVQDVRFFKHRVEVVLRELLADKRGKGC